MPTSEGCLARRQRLWDALPEPADAIVITQPESLVYFAGYVPSPFTFRPTESSAALVMLPDRAILLADDLLKPDLERSRVDEVASYEWYSGRSPAEHRGAMLAEAFARYWPKTVGNRIGVEYSSIPACFLDGLADLPEDETYDLTNVEPLIRELRRVKDDDELVLMRRSAKAGEAAHSAVLRNMVPGMSELDAFLIVQEAAIRAVGEPVLVYGDFVASGPNTSRRDRRPSNRGLEAGELLLLDFSVVVRGYRTDFTNTLVIGGQPTPRQQEIVDACLGALAAGEASLGPGRKARDVDAAVRGHFASLGLADYFQSHTGHGLGLGHPEPPFLVPESDETLMTRDVVAIEPGLDVPGVGLMRFERNYLITEDGFESLTHHQLTLAR